MWIFVTSKKPILCFLIILYQYPLACFIAHERNPGGRDQLHAARAQPSIQT